MVERSPSEVDGIKGLANQLRTDGTYRTRAWQDDHRFHCDFSITKFGIRALLDIQREDRGKSDVRWILSPRPFKNGAMLGFDGAPLRLPEFRKIAEPSDTIGDIVSWTRTADNQLVFRCKRLSYPLGNVPAAQFRSFCELLVANFPDITRFVPVDSELLAVSPTEDTWFVRQVRTGVEVLRCDVNQKTSRIGCFNSLAEVHQRLKKDQIKFRPHPLVTRFVQPWSLQGSLDLSLRRLLQRCRARRHDKGLTAQKTREARWRNQHHQLAEALDNIKWRDVHKIEGSSSYQRHVFY